VDWLSTGNSILQSTKEEVCRRVEQEGSDHAKRVMIYPRDSKFELSYEQPYFELIGRLQKTLRTENTFLITLGFSFNDKHLRSIVLEALKQNPSLHLLVITYPDIVEDQELKLFASIDNRIMLVSDTFTEFANAYPDNTSFSNDDPLDIIVNMLSEKMKQNEHH
jgi:hypothetical protein